MTNPKTNLRSEVKRVLDFWFGEKVSGEKAYFKERNKLWFSGGEKLDNRIREEFGAEVARAARGELSDWEQDPESCLALIVLLDQFSLNIYRDQPLSFVQSAMAAPIALRAIIKGFDLKLAPAQRVFIYLPIEHNENQAMQDKSVELFRKLAEDAPADQRDSMAGYLDFAIRHYDVVKRFGRYPDRNSVFLRADTTEEAEYMAQGGPPF